MVPCILRSVCTCRAEAFSNIDFLQTKFERLAQIERAAMPKTTALAASADAPERDTTPPMPAVVTSTTSTNLVCPAYAILGPMQ